MERAYNDRSFGLLKDLYFGTVASYFGFPTITGAAIVNPALALWKA